MKCINALELHRKLRDARISCTWYQATASCAAFIKESRMKCINALELRYSKHAMISSSTRTHLFDGAELIAYKIFCCRCAILGAGFCRRKR
jgi:hypothetical protein